MSLTKRDKLMLPVIFNLRLQTLFVVLEPNVNVQNEMKKKMLEKVNFFLAQINGFFFSRVPVTALYKSILV